MGVYNRIAASIFRISQNGLKDKESSVIIVPPPEVYKICELQEEIVISQ